MELKNLDTVLVMADAAAKLNLAKLAHADIEESVRRAVDEMRITEATLEWRRAEVQMLTVKAVTAARGKKDADAAMERAVRAYHVTLTG